MHALINLATLAIGAFAVLVIWWEIRRKRHYIAFLLRTRPWEAERAKGELAECLVMGGVFAVLVFVALVVVP